MRKTSRIVEKHMDLIGTLQDLVRLTGSIYGDDIPVVWNKTSGEEYRRSYRQFCDDVSAVADSLTGNGICKERIAVMGTMDYRWLTAFLGIISSGNIAVPLDRSDNTLDEKIELADLYGIYMDETVKDRETFAAETLRDALSREPDPSQRSGGDRIFRKQPETCRRNRLTAGACGNPGDGKTRAGK